jgi:hypothetical protein
MGAYRYFSYNGAWGMHGPAAEDAYLDRTDYWAKRFHAAASAKKTQ